MIRAAISDNIWKLSAIRAMLFVKWPTTSSTTKKLPVKPNIDRRRHLLPVYRPIVVLFNVIDQIFPWCAWCSILQRLKFYHNFIFGQWCLANSQTNTRFNNSIDQLIFLHLLYIFWKWLWFCYEHIKSSMTNWLGPGNVIAQNHYLLRVIEKKHCFALISNLWWPYVQTFLFVARHQYL